MNSNDRAALVQWIREELHLAWSAGNGLLIAQEPHQRTMQSLEQEIDRLLADRAVVVAVEPDAETVERVGTAIAEALGASIGPDGYRVYVDWDALVQASRAAIAAMPSSCADDEPYLGPPDKGATVKATVVEADDVPMFPDLGTDDDSWLDEALTALTTDGLPGTAVSIYRHDNEWGAQQMTTYLEEPDSPADICGHGATAREAILDAVAKVKEAQQ